MCFAGLVFGSENEGNWDFQRAPLYLWMVNLEGEMGIATIDRDVDVDFSTIFDNLEAVLLYTLKQCIKATGGCFLITIIWM